MQAEYVDINLFYPILFLTIIIISGLITFCLFKNKDNDLLGNIFNKSSDNAKEITLDINEKASKAHSEVSKVNFTEAHEKEMHRLEELILEINGKVDNLIERVSNLENNK